MKEKLQWFGLVAAFVVLISGSFGCATMLATEAATDHRDFYDKPVLSDAIIAIGRPDESLAKRLGKEHVVAFIGLKHTYLLFNGGDELEQVAQLKLDGHRMAIDSTISRNLYLKDKQVWGQVVLTYRGAEGISAAEKMELERGGFTAATENGKEWYWKRVEIEGVLYPALKLSDEQLSRLTIRRPFNLYPSIDVEPPPLNIGATLMIPLAVATDIVLTPVYLGVGVILLIDSAR